MKKLKNIGIIILMLTVGQTARGQQFLWSTLKSDSGSTKKYVPMDNITKEVLTFYNQYDYYFDLSGYSKTRFIKEVKYGFDDWSWLNSIKDLTIYAVKSNTGRGSVVMVLCVSKDNVNLLLFSSDILAHKNPHGTNQYEKEKFVDLFKSLLN